MLIRRGLLLALTVGPVVVTGCMKQPQTSIAVTGARSFDLTDVERDKLTAAALTNTAAAYRLYQFYELVRFDQGAAMKWLKKSAEGGDAEAQYSLGVYLTYLPGYTDLEQSKAWLAKSAAQGYEPAKKMLSDSPK